MTRRASATISSQYRSTDALCESCMRLARRTAGNVSPSVARAAASEASSVSAADRTTMSPGV